MSNMAQHSKTLEETSIWMCYQKKVFSDDKRIQWVKDVYGAAVEYLKDVRTTFGNYTLHDETHVLNVLDAMAGLLGEQISNLSVGEAELLILSACLHDIGMVYTDKEISQLYNNKKICEKFLRENCPEWSGYSYNEWPKDIRLWFLRKQHPFRLPQILQNKEWKVLFDEIPNTAIQKKYIIAVCQSHGEDPKSFIGNSNLKYLEASETDILFCAILLCLADLLDFDDTRAPKILYDYVECNKESRKEWDKHRASAGFTYPTAPSLNELPYKAKCTNPNIEHAIRDFLDIVDDMLNMCSKLKQHCRHDWQRNFPFPRAILREEIESDGYMSGDFKLTMDQNKILELLSGENLYDNNDVFVRELLQNAIDATLLRHEMDNGFSLDDARIDFWEWVDEKGYIWLRIDDRGTGMTLGMLQRYFLKVGNSYYTSKELIRDLRDHGQEKDYVGISRFGIGFLSCFLCGDYAEVSTLYFDSEKNSREEGKLDSSQLLGYGLRLQVTGLAGYYTIKNQAKNHASDTPFPLPNLLDNKELHNLESDGYRIEPGTSISIRLEPGRLGAISLRETVEKYLCYPQMPVYYNGERVGQTYKELMRIAHKLEGERIYDLSDEYKKKFDECFPKIKGQYPKLAVTVIPLDTKKYQVLTGLSGVLIKYDVHFDKEPKWIVDNQEYRLSYDFSYDFNNKFVNFKSDLFNNIHAYKYIKYNSWYDFKEIYNNNDINALELKFMQLSSCPTSPEQLGEVWFPFEKTEILTHIWRLWIDKNFKKNIYIGLEEYKFIDILKNPLDQINFAKCAYHGVIAAGTDISSAEYIESVFLLEGELQPTVKISRSNITKLPLKVLVAIHGILNISNFNIFDAENVEYTLREWRQLERTKLDSWLKNNFKNTIMNIKKDLQKSDIDEPDILNIKKNFFGHFIFNSSQYIYCSNIIKKYIYSYLQCAYQMTINYNQKQVIGFDEKIPNKYDNVLDLFPPMMFCKADTDKDRQYLCCAYSNSRRGVTSDHPFSVWLIKNSAALDRYYKCQFNQIISCLCNKEAKDIIQECNSIREQIIALPEHHGVDIKIPQLSDADFWIPPE